MKLSQEDIDSLEEAKKILENPGFGIKIVNYIGKPVEFALEKIDSKIINNASKKALNKLLDIAISSIDLKSIRTPSNPSHTHAILTS